MPPKKATRDPQFIRKTMAWNVHWSAPMLAKLVQILQSDETKESGLEEFEATYTESYKQLVFLPLVMQQTLNNFDSGAPRRYYADFAQDYGNTVMTIHTLGWALIDADYENVIRDSASLIMDAWAEQQDRENRNKRGFHGFLPAFQMRGAQQRKDKTWVVRWGNLDDSLTLETEHYEDQPPILMPPRN